MTYSQFINLTSLKNIYTLCGDSFLATECVKFIKEKLNIESEYDISKFDNENFSCDALIESCEQISFFAKNRLCIVKDIKQILESERKKLLKYLENINSYTTLIFIDTLNSKVFDFIKAEKVELKLNDYELNEYVIKEFKKYGKQISKEAINTLAIYCLKDMNKINLEIQKLVAYCLNKVEITENDIKLLVSESEELVVFELTNLLGQKKAEKSLTTLYKLMGNIEQNTKLFSLLSTTFQRMFFAVLSKSLTDEEIAKIFSVKTFAITKLKQQAKNYTISALKDIVYEICDVEYYIKSGKMTLDNALVYIVMYIVNR